MRVCVCACVLVVGVESPMNFVSVCMYAYNIWCAVCVVCQQGQCIHM